MTIDEHHNRLNSLEDRAAALEARASAIELVSAVGSEKYLNILSRLDKLDSSFDRFEANISKLAWLVIAAIVGGFMTFVIRGGLSI